MIGLTTSSATPLHTLIASGDGENQQGTALLVVILAVAAIVAVLNIIVRLQQPRVFVLDNPFKFFMKAIMFGVTTTVVVVTIVSILLVSAGVPS